MLFNFTLVPVEHVQPWGNPGMKSLHWFGLTDGQYWIEAGDDVLFEYSEHVRSKPGSTRYCAYQVARLYEDLLEMVPSILEPVPASLVSYLTGEGGSAWMAKSASWSTSAFESLDEERYWAISDASVTWIGSRTLDAAYLSPSTNIRLWSEQSAVHIEWDNTEKLCEGLPAWSAIRGSFRMPREAFIHEVRAFHERFMDQMAQRVANVVAGALSPDVQIDLPALHKEQLQRCRAIEHAFSGSAVATDWQLVTGAIAEVERGAHGRQV